MRNIKLTLVFIFITVLASCQNENIDSILQKQFNSEELSADLEFIKERIISKKYNRTPFLFIEQNEFDQKYDSVKQIISNNESMSMLEFYKLVTPLLSSVCDDHLIFPLFGLWAIENNKPIVFENNILWPASAIIHDNNFYITCSSFLPNNARIVSINDIPNSQIIKQLIKYSPYSSQRYYKAHGILPLNLDDYSLLLYSLFNFSDSIDIRYQNNNSDKIENVSISLEKFYDINVAKTCRKENNLSDYELRFEDNTAILRLNTFNYRDFNKSILLYNKLFNKIKKNKSQKLIIDISQNGGGSDINWIILLYYLTEKSMQFNCKKPKVKVPEVLKDLKIDQSKIDLNALYEGDIYLIIGSKTFSSAVRFADVMKSNGVCDKIFGQETLGQVTHYGQYKKYFLPNTKLKINISSKLFPSINCSESRTGVIPDFNIELKSIEDYFNYSKNEFTIKQTMKMIK